VKYLDLEVTAQLPVDPPVMRPRESGRHRHPRPGIRLKGTLRDDFERLEVGTGVRYCPSEGEQGPQASTVKIVDKPGRRASKVEDPQIEPPESWKP
jgi:hypothetical protein